MRASIYSTLLSRLAPRTVNSNNPIFYRSQADNIFEFCFCKGHREKRGESEGRKRNQEELSLCFCRASIYLYFVWNFCFLIVHIREIIQGNRRSCSIRLSIIFFVHSINEYWQAHSIRHSKYIKYIKMWRNGSILHFTYMACLDELFCVRLLFFMWKNSYVGNKLASF